MYPAAEPTRIGACGWSTVVRGSESCAVLYTGCRAAPSKSEEQETVLFRIDPIGTASQVPPVPISREDDLRASRGHDDPAMINWTRFRPKSS